MKTLKEMGNIKGKRILVRVDFNVPLVSSKVRDDFRIKKAIPTIEYLRKKGAIVILISHIGEDGTQSLKPVADALRKYIPVTFINTPVLLDDTDAILKKMKNGEVVLLENLRRESGEKKNDISFARGLSRLGDFYVNEAFPVSHRVQASIVSVPKYLESFAGLQFEDEIKHLSMAFEPSHPFLFILGGAKFETKIPLIQKFLKSADTVFIGGALMNDFFREKGYEVGTSLLDDGKFNLKNLIKNQNLILPTDIEVVSGNKKRIALVNNCTNNEKIVDIGPESIKNLSEMILKAKFILWNGPLGKYEEGFGGSTEKILKTIANAKTKSVLGGGDTVAIISKLKIENKFTFVSTGGGAMLEFLAKGTLPGIKALK